MKHIKRLLFISFTIGALILSACNFPTAGNPDESEATNVALTANAIFTQAAETANILVPSATTIAEATLPPTNTALPPTAPPLTATNTPIPCNRASFVKDVTYPDGAKVPAGSAFTKTWRIKNNGSCTWTSGYVLLFDSGDRMNAPAPKPITSGTVAPGATVDISVNLTAPGSPGSYQGNFKLRSADNIVFGVNADAQGPFWVKIVVPNPTSTPTDTPAPTLPPPPPPLFPDLIVQSIVYSPAAPHQGDTVDITVSVYNQGNAASGPYTVEWYAAGPTLGCSWSIAGSDASGGRVLHCQYTYSGWNHAYTTKAIVDAGNAVPESDESNNTLSVTLDVSP